MKEFLDGLVAFIGGAGGAVVLLTPGFIMSRVLSRDVAGPELGERTFLATIAAGSLLVHAAALAWTVPLFANEFDRFPNLDASDYMSVLAWVVVVLFLGPAVLGGALAHLAERTSGPVNAILEWFGLSAIQRKADAWTWTFGKLSRAKHGRWLQVRLRDGETYLAAFGSNSFVSSDPRLRDVYLEETWDL